MNPFSFLPSRTSLPLLATLVLTSASAWSQQNAAPAAAPYTLPPVLVITPSPGGANPYLTEVPPPPAQAAEPVAPPPPPEAESAETAAQNPSLADLGRSLRNYFTEDEINVLFEYMKDSVVAAFKGEEVTLPPDLAFKLEILQARVKKEGGLYMSNLMKQLERDLKRSLKEKMAPPGSAPAKAPAASQSAPDSVPVAQPAPAAGSGKLQLHVRKSKRNA